MSAHVRWNLLNLLPKNEKCKACQAFYHFFAKSSINSIKHENSCEILFIT